MNSPTSLGYRTDLIFSRFEGEVIDRGDYLVIRTPSNPGYHWGNFLLFDGPPGPGGLEVWMEAFEREIASRQPTHHIALAWDGVDGEVGEVGPFVAWGMELERSVVLTTRELRAPSRPNLDVTVRPIDSDRDWFQALDNQIACRDLQYELERYRVFKQRQLRRYRLMSEADLGAWYGAFLGDELVADLGVYGDGAVGRFQSVGTAPDHRRRGVCATLVHAAGLDAMDRFGLETLVMVADPDYHAARIYESVGFAPAEKVAALHWREG